MKTEFDIGILLFSIPTGEGPNLHIYDVRQKKSLKSCPVLPAVTIYGIRTSKWFVYSEYDIT